jgi:hypothetical protein
MREEYNVDQAISRSDPVMVVKSQSGRAIKMRTGVITIMVAVAAAQGCTQSEPVTTSDALKKAPLVQKIKIRDSYGPGSTGLYTNGNLLVAVLYVDYELKCWDWNDLKTPPKTTPELKPRCSMVLGDGMIIEDVLLGISHELLEDEKKREKETWDPRMKESRQREIAQFQKWVDREDRTVAQMKYLQEIKRAGGKAVVLHNFAGTDFSTIDCGNEKGRRLSGFAHSKNGRFLGVWSECCPPERRGTCIGILDLKARTVRWGAATIADEKKGRREPNGELKAAISDDGRRFVLLGSNGDGGWICMMDTEKQAVLWEHWGVPRTINFDSGDISPDGKEVYVGDRLGRILCFDGDTGKQITKQVSPIPGNYVRVSPDGRLLVVAPGSASHGILICDARSGEALQYANPPGMFCDVAISPDNTRIAVSGDNAIWVFDVTAAHDAVRSSGARSQPAKQSK